MMIGNLCHHLSFVGLLTPFINNYIDESDKIYALHKIFNIRKMYKPMVLKRNISYLHPHIHATQPYKLNLRINKS